METNPCFKKPDKRPKKQQNRGEREEKVRNATVTIYTGEPKQQQNYRLRAKRNFPEIIFHNNVLRNIFWKVFGFDINFYKIL